MIDIYFILGPASLNQFRKTNKNPNFNVLSHRVDELFRMAEDFGDFGLILESDVVTVNDCAADHSADTSNANKDTTTSSGADDQFKSAGEKLKVKEVFDTSINSELASCVNDWFRKGIEDDRYTELTEDSVNARPANCE